MLNIQRYKNLNRLLLDDVDIVSSNAEMGKIISCCFQQSIQQPVVVSFVNAHAVNLAFNNPAFLECLGSSDWLFRDGIGISLLYRAQGHAPGLNMNGTDFIPMMLEQAICDKRDIILLGTESPWLDDAALSLERKGGNVIFSHHGFEDASFYLSQIDWTQFQNPVVVLAMGMPMQELIASRLAKHLTNGLILNGGAVLDFIGGKVTRAPLIWRKLRLEWFYRLIHEPRRLFRRYVIGNLIFLARIPILLMVKIHFQLNDNSLDD